MATGQWATRKREAIFLWDTQRKYKKVTPKSLFSYTGKHAEFFQSDPDLLGCDSSSSRFFPPFFLLYLAFLTE